MTPNPARGRPRSEEHRNAVLKAAMELIQENELHRSASTLAPTWCNVKATSTHSNRRTDRLACPRSDFRP
jgi:hypothetical protein